MSVYIDNYFAPFGRMRMSHMVADTTEELLAMADTIGVSRRWIQKAGTHREHFDVCKEKRLLAIEAGAQAVTVKELAKIIIRRRPDNC